MNTKKVMEMVSSGVAAIHVQGRDFLRIDEEIEKASIELGFKVLEWNLGYGWVDFKSKRAIKIDQNPSLYEDLKVLADEDPTHKIYVIKNAFSALSNDYKARACLQQEILRIQRYFQGNSIIFLVDNVNLNFLEISDLVTTVNCSPFTSKEAEEFLEKCDISISTTEKISLVSIFSGMEKYLVNHIFNVLRHKYGKHFPVESIDDALRLKKADLAQSDLLELVDSTINIDQIGGLGKLKEWLQNKKYIFNDIYEAQNFGIRAPKGILLAGIPGCGKSMSAKSVASLFNLPLFRLDIGSLMGKFVGESEANMKKALTIAEKASPCVLWIDELEKAFSGINGIGGSTEITTRLFGYFLTWMQEKKGSVFVVATANDITTLPPELLRRGRFDEIFYIDLPNHRERMQIFKVKIKALNLVAKDIDFEKLASDSEGFSGADIECVINDALEDLFRNNQNTLTQSILNKYLDLIIPIGVVLKEKIESYQEIFGKFSLKAASFSLKDIQNIDDKIRSSDIAERENAANNERISADSLMFLTKDDNLSVRYAALKNPQCPFNALKDIVCRYEPFNFTKPGGVWGKNHITKGEFKLALHHPNMRSRLIIELYKRQKIDNNMMLSLAQKLSEEDKKDVFDIVSVKLGNSIPAAIVENIRCVPGELIDTNSVLIEVDDMTGCTKKIIASTKGVISQILVKRGDAILSNQEIAQLFILR